MPAPINKMSELFFQSSSVELPYSRNNILLNDFCKQSDKLGEGGGMSEVGVTRVVAICLYYLKYYLKYSVCVGQLN